MAGLPEQPASPQGGPADPGPRRLNSPAILIDLVENAGDWAAFGDIAAIEALVQNAADAVAGAQSIAVHLPSSEGAVEVVVALSSDAEVAILNGQYRGKTKPTNVLSFPATAAAPSVAAVAMSLGDIVLAAETVQAEASDLGIAPADHLRHLIVHGLLHLLGYDHIESAQADEMEALETQILATIGVADPYAGSEPADVVS